MLLARHRQRLARLATLHKCRIQLTLYTNAALGLPLPLAMRAARFVAVPALASAPRGLGGVRSDGHAWLCAPVTATRAKKRPAPRAGHDPAPELALET